MKAMYIYSEIDPIAKWKVKQTSHSELQMVSKQAVMACSKHYAHVFAW